AHKNARRSRGRLGCEPANVRTQHRNRSWRDSRDPQCLAQRIGLHLAKPLNDLARKPWNSVERKVGRNSAPFIPTCALDFALLPAQISRVLDGSFSAREIERRARRLNLESRQTILRQEIGETDFRLTKQLACRDAITGRRLDERGVQHLKVACKARATRLEPLPPLI